MFSKLFLSFPTSSQFDGDQNHMTENSSLQTAVPPTIPQRRVLRVRVVIPKGMSAPSLTTQIRVIFPGLQLMPQELPGGVLLLELAKCGLTEEQVTERLVAHGHTLAPVREHQR